MLRTEHRPFGATVPPAICARPLPAPRRSDTALHQRIDWRRAHVTTGFVSSFDIHPCLTPTPMILFRILNLF